MKEHDSPTRSQLNFVECCAGAGGLVPCPKRSRRL